MNREQLDEIRHLHRGWRVGINTCPQQGEPCIRCAERAAATAERVPALLDEIERLNAQLNQAQQFIQLYGPGGVL